MPDLASFRPGSGGVIFALVETNPASSKIRLPILDRHLSDRSRMEVRARVRTNGTDVMTAVRLEDWKKRMSLPIATEGISYAVRW